MSATKTPAKPQSLTAVAKADTEAALTLIKQGDFAAATDRLEAALRHLRGKR